MPYAPDRETNVMGGAHQKSHGEAGLGAIVDLERYPIDQPRAPRYRETLETVWRGMRATGCLQLKGFVLPGAVAEMSAEVDGKRDFFDYSKQEINPYFTPDDPSLPDDHPVRLRQMRGNWWLCRDRIDAHGLMTRLFESDRLMAFIKDVFRAAVLYRYGDPISGFLVNVQDGGDTLPWHFDTNESTISILLRKPSRGGRFEYAPNLRTNDDPNYSGVGDIVRGKREGVLVPDMEPGDLQIFAGRFSLHRVTAVEGDESRYSLILGYADKPDIITTKNAALGAFGRSHPMHDLETAASALVGS